MSKTGVKYQVNTMDTTSNLMTIKQAGKWASELLGRNITPSNISYLIQYGRIKRFTEDGNTWISKEDLIKYYESYHAKRETEWVRKLGDDLNWSLSFDHLKEAETTKHVHRLHPYKGKFIPQLVEYFLDNHVNDFKKDVYFKKGDTILDPFCGSGTALVQANELGMHSIGIDVSSFNALISNVKTNKYNLVDLHSEVLRVTSALREFVSNSNTVKFESSLKEALANFNTRYFPSPEFKLGVRAGDINEEEYGTEKENDFKLIYDALVAQYNIDLSLEDNGTFLNKWYMKHVRREIDFVKSLIEQISDQDIRNVLVVVLSRTIRSCRATTHFDLATLKDPVTSTYYCHKHGKICKPLFSIVSWWVRYSKNTIERLTQFDKLRTDTHQVCLTGDSRTINIVKELEENDQFLARLIKDQGIKGIFSSPPYVGLIDYHDQHAYAYDLFHFERKDQLEIGPLSSGQGADARESYVRGISEVLNNCIKYLANDYDVFLVANDKYDLYPLIAEKANMQIVNRHKRPVLNRTERDKGAYSETIFHLKG